jgi:hypothetical protein
MEKNIFKLDNEQLKAIARSFKEKVEKLKTLKSNAFLPLLLRRLTISTVNHLCLISEEPIIG